MRALLKSGKFWLLVALLFVGTSLFAQTKPECNSKAIRARLISLPSMTYVKVSDTTLGFRVEIGKTIKISRQGQVLKEVDPAAAYLAYKQRVGKIDYFLFTTIGTKNHSYLFVNEREIRQIEPKLQDPNYDYFQAVIDGKDILFDFSQSGERVFHLGTIADGVFCDGGEVPQ
jgi:hypothetical protein